MKEKNGARSILHRAPRLLLAEKSANDVDGLFDEFKAHIGGGKRQTKLKHERIADGRFDAGEDRGKPRQNAGDSRSDVDEQFGQNRTPFHILIINKAVTKCNRFFNLFDFFILICFWITQNPPRENDASVSKRKPDQYKHDDK